MTDNATAAAAMIRGATIALGDGSYFDFIDPSSTTMTIDDYAYALAYTVRCRGQTWFNGRRCFYSVGQHVIEGAEQMLVDGCDPIDAFGFLMHESDEMPLGDMVGPAKQLPEMEGYKVVAKRCGAAIDAHFGVHIRDKALVKRYDIRMLATEKRDLMPQTMQQEWQWTEGYEPFPTMLVPYKDLNEVAETFIAFYHFLREKIGG